MKELAYKTKNATLWIGAAEVISQLVRLVTNLLLTRMLVPDLFGLMAVANAIVIGMSMMSDIGLQPSIVQNRDGNKPAFLNTAWILQIIRGAIIFCLVFIVAAVLMWHSSEPSLSVYSDPVLPMVLIAVGFTTLIAGFNSTSMLLAYKELKVIKVTILQLAAQIVSATLMVVWAYFYPSIWSLIGGAVLNVLIVLVGSHTLISSERNRFQWDKTYARQIIMFGGWIFLSTILAYVINQYDKLYFASKIDAARLGVYSIAFFLSSAITMLLSRIYGAVLFPMLSVVHNEKPGEMKSAYYKLRIRVDLMTFIGSGFLITSAPQIIDLLYDIRYQDAGWMLRILAISCLIYGFHLSEQCLIAIGQVKQTTIGNFLHAMLLLILLPLGFFVGGLKLALFALVLSPISRIIYSSYNLYRNGIFDMRYEFRAAPSIIIGILLGFAFNSVPFF